MSRIAATAAMQLRANIRVCLRYRADFLVGNLGTMVQAVAGVAAYLLLFTTLGEFGTWTAGQWTLILGLVTTSRGLWNTFFVGTLDTRELIRTGKLDTFLVRPVSSLFLVTTARMSPDLWGETAVGVFLILFGLHTSGLAVTLGVVAALLVTLVIGTTIYYALFLLVETTAFWLVDNSMLSVLFERLDEYSRVPLSIFPAWLRAMFSSVLPLAMVGYLPGLVIFGRSGPWLLGLAAAVALGFVLLAIWLWGLGLRKYSGAG
ncbi:ABC transporter permease [Micromonospora sp. NPDC003197]